VRGFFAELLNKIPVTELHDRLAAAVERRLADPARVPARDEARLAEVNV